MDNPVYKLLIVEDDLGIAQAIQTQASLWNFDVRIVENFRDVTGEVTSFSPHIILLDITLPFFNGYHWCSEIRKFSRVPIIFISSAADNMNIIMAMNLGADDFVAKPFDLNVLLAKIQALLRRSYDFAGSSSVIEHKGVMFQVNDGTITYNGVKLELTKNESKIMQTLLANKEEIVTRDTLMTKLWESDSYVDENTLSVNVNRLRKKLAEIGLENFIITKKGIGYRIG